MKTPKEFDYDLFKDQEGKCFIRIKRTGDVTEVSDETFRLLRNEAMAMYREQKGIPVYGKKDGKSIVITYTTLLSIELGDAEKTPAWLAYDPNIEELVYTQTAEEAFKQELTARQRDIFENCMLKGVSAAEYARNNKVSKPLVSKYVKQIQKIAKKFFDLG